MKLKNVINKIIDNRGRTPEYGSEGVPMLEIKQIDGVSKYPKSSFEKFVDPKLVNDFVRDPLKKGDVLIATVGATAGKSAIVERDPEYFIAQNLVGFRSNSSTAPEFLFYVSQSVYFREGLFAINKANTIDNLKVSIFINNNCVVPPLEEQTVIANFLDDKTAQIDKLITNKQKLIELLKEERTAVINHAVTCGINPKVKLKESGIEWLGKIPKHWEMKKLKYIGKIVLGKMLTNDDKGDYNFKPYLRAANLQWLDANIENVKEMWFSKMELEKLRIKEYDLLVSEGGEVGRTCIWRNELDECYIQNSVHKITIVENQNPFFFLYQFFYLGSIGYFESIVNRISIGHLTGEKIRELYIWSPNMDEQLQIVQQVETETKRIDGTISKIENEIELLAEYRTALISEVVTGKIDVSNKV
ncbi:MAG: restriction endonuclease subunit S [Ignavibacteriaceae bacterium]|nr:restriction endonuclease subunit S [Ignavibacteriaceae bacterium]